MRGTAETLEIGNATLRAEARAVPWARAALALDGTLHRHAARTAVATLSGGRGAAHVVESEAERWVVRHYRRGGAVAALTADRYVAVGQPRPFREWDAVRAVRAAGVPTPAAVVAAVYREGATYRGDLVTVLVPDAETLAQRVQRSGEDPEGWEDLREGLRSAGRLARRLAEAGAFHVDFNASNVLLTSGSEPPAWVLDLDRCRIGSGAPDRLTVRMVARMLRSLDRGTPDEGVPPRWEAALREGAA